MPAARRPSPQVTIRVFVFSPGAIAATPTTGNPNFAGEITWLQACAATRAGLPLGILQCGRRRGVTVCCACCALQDMMGEEGGQFTREQLDLTPALKLLGRTKPAVQEAADPANLAKGPALVKAPLRLQGG